MVRNMTDFHKRSSVDWLKDFGTAISVACLWLVAQLPLPWMLAFGRGSGRLLYHVMQRRTNITRQNIHACFPNLDKELQEKLTRECIIENICGLFESAKAWWGNMQPILDETEVHGLHILQEAAKAGTGVLLIGAHYTTLDMGGRIVSSFWPVTILYRPFNNAFYDKIILNRRKSFYDKVIEKNRMRDLVRALQQGATLWYPADQDYGVKDSVFATFFGIQAATLATTAGLAKLCRGQVVGLFHHRLPDNRYRIEFHQMDDFPAQDTEAAATQANAMIEKGVNLNPAQYMWVHRRFKTRPAGEPEFYQ